MYFTKLTIISAVTGLVMVTPTKAQTSKAELRAHMELASGNYCKFLMNENETSVLIKTDIYPFYHWKNVRAYYRDMLKNANITYKKNKK